MAKKKRGSKAQPLSRPETPPPPAFNRPFGALAALKRDLESKPAAAKSPVKVRSKSAPEAAASPPPSVQPAAPSADDTLFMMEMADVTPLAGADKRAPKKSLPAEAWSAPLLPNEDLEVLRSLSDLVSGKSEFDLTYTDEYVEGQTRGLPPVLMEKLRAGRIPYQDHLDLHGFTLAQAEAAVTRFILDSVALGRSCVLLIHGRGLGSQDGVPVLKRYLETFLLRGTVRKYLLAFTSARPIDGGVGASYILLRG